MSGCSAGRDGTDLFAFYLMGVLLDAHLAQPSNHLAPFDMQENAEKRGGLAPGKPKFVLLKNFAENGAKIG